MTIKDTAEDAKDKAKDTFEDVRDELRDRFDGDDEDDVDHATPDFDGTY